MQIQNQKPLISVIVPVYNPGKYLVPCLDSIVNQTYENLEIILIDDGSTDGIGEICDAYARKDARIICVHQANAGVSNARNQGLQRMHGDYVHFPDSDDYLELDTYEYLLERMREHCCDVVNFEHFVTYPERETAHAFSTERYGLFDTQGTLWQMVNGVQFCCNKLFCARLIKGEHEGERLFFREDIHRGEDTLLAALAIARAERVWFDSRPLYHYVQSEQSACRGSFRRSQMSILKLYEAYEPLYKQKYPEIWQDFLLFMQDVLISLYYDTWADPADLSAESSELARTVRKRYRQIEKKIPIKKRLKFMLFCASPALFCRVHKLIHKL
jgi:glycosyltransferase involved in cell wall biosynthesis